MDVVVVVVVDVVAVVVAVVLVVVVEVVVVVFAVVVAFWELLLIDVPLSTSQPGCLRIAFNDSFRFPCSTSFGGGNVIVQPPIVTFTNHPPPHFPKDSFFSQPESHTALDAKSLVFQTKSQHVETYVRAFPADAEFG